MLIGDYKRVTRPTQTFVCLDAEIGFGVNGAITTLSIDGVCLYPVIFFIFDAKKTWFVDLRASFIMFKYNWLRKCIIVNLTRPGYPLPSSSDIRFWLFTAGQVREFNMVFTSYWYNYCFRMRLPRLIPHWVCSIMPLITKRTLMRWRKLMVLLALISRMQQNMRNLWANLGMLSWLDFMPTKVRNFNSA